MIFVTVGTQKFPFERLIRAVDMLTGENTVIHEPVYMQIGTSKYIPKNCQFERYLSRASMSQKIQECFLVITHAGVGTILEAVKYGKKVLVVPRLKKYGEHVDNHQIEIAKAFECKHYLSVCTDIERLGECIIQAKNTMYAPFVSENEYMNCLILDYLKNH